MTHAGLPQEELHYRVPQWTAVGPLVVLASWLWPYLFGPPGWPRMPLPLVLLYVALVVASVAFQRWAGLVLTPTHAVVRGLRVRRIPWSKITGVGQQNVFGADRIVLWVEDGRTVRTRAPYAAFGIGYNAFQRKFHTIGQWWLAHH